MLKGKAKVSNEIRREQVTQAVFDIVAHHGARRLTTAAIACQAGLSEGNLYRHFKDKNEILASAVDMIGEGLFHNLETVASSDESSNLMKLKTLFALHLEYIEQNKGIARFVFSEEIHVGNNKLREKLLDTINGYAKGVDKLIKEGQSNGTISKQMDSQALALTIIGMIQISTMRWSLKGFSFSLADEGMKLWNNFERCIST
jgi:TetR/AcrR family transcriptional regulator, fatty acid metabolism regulator protein